MNKQSERQLRYDKDHVYRVEIKLNCKTDADIIEMLEAAPSKQGLIKEALRNYNKGTR